MPTMNALNLDYTKKTQKMLRDKVKKGFPKRTKIKAKK